MDVYDVILFIPMAIVWFILAIISVILTTLVLTAMFWLGSTVFLPMFPGM